MPNLEWKATAIADLLAIIDYISDDNPDAAQVLKDEIEHKTSLLPERPQMYRAGRVAPGRVDRRRAECGRAARAMVSSGNGRRV